MGKYIARKVGQIRPVRSYWADDAPMVPDLRVDAAKPYWTGLLDAHGNELWRQPNPCGFGRDEEWE